MLLRVRHTSRTAAQKPRAPSPTATTGACSPRRGRSRSTSAQLSVLSRYPILERDELLRPVGPHPNHHQGAEPVVFEPDVEVDAVDPHIHVVPVGQVALPERPVVRLPHGGQARDVGGTEAGRVVAEQHRQRLTEVARRQSTQIQDRQHLGHLGRSAHVGRGRMRLVNRWRCPSAVTRLSFTRGAGTTIVPAPQVTFRAFARPLRTTSRRPASSRSSLCSSMYCATSVASAVISIRRAPSRASSSSVGPAPSSWWVRCLHGRGRVPSAWVASPFTGLPAGGSALLLRERIRRLLHAADPQLPVISQSGVKEPLTATMSRPEISRPGASWRGGDAERGGQNAY